MKISLIQPSRNNLKYLQWSYNSIRKNQGKHTVEICVADDFSSDGLADWCKSTEKKDKHFKWIQNKGPKGQLDHLCSSVKIFQRKCKRIGLILGKLGIRN